MEVRQRQIERERMCMCVCVTLTSRWFNILRYSVLRASSVTRIRSSCNATQPGQILLTQAFFSFLKHLTYLGGKYDIN